MRARGKHLPHFTTEQRADDGTHSSHSNTTNGTLLHTHMGSASSLAICFGGRDARLVQAFRRQIADSAAAIRAVFRNPNLRWIQLASLATNLGNWGYTVGVSLYAYKVGGVTDVGIIWLLRTLPASLLAPIGGVIADRFPRQRVMLSTELIRAPMIVAGAVCIWSSLSPDFVYAIATANSIVR